MTFSSRTQPDLVTPAKAGVGLFFYNGAPRRDAGEGSLTPDQVRGDEEIEQGVTA
jgi:hypothetical protein